MTAGQDAREAQWLKWRSVADLYHAFFTGLILTVVTRRGTADAAEFVFRVFRRQQQERFLPGLEKLGLDHLPPAVAAAQAFPAALRAASLPPRRAALPSLRRWPRWRPARFPPPVPPRAAGRSCR